MGWFRIDRVKVYSEGRYVNVQGALQSRSEVSD